jgi:hypothetical protein
VQAHDRARIYVHDRRSGAAAESAAVVAERGLVNDVADLARSEPLHVESGAEDLALDALIVSIVPRGIADGDYVLIHLERRGAQWDR